MNKNFVFSTLFLLTSLTPIFLFGQNYTIESIPNPKAGIGNGYVSNPDNILNPADVQRINSLIAYIEDTTQAQIAVVLVNSIGEENPKDFSTQLFNHWGIGQKYADNGLLIFSVMDQRRTEFETGLGMEAVLPDAVCYRIGMQKLVPHFKLKEYGAGIIAALQDIQNILENPDVVQEFSNNREIYGNQSKGFPAWWWYIMVNLLFHLALLVWVILTLYNKEELYDKYMSIRPIWGWWFMIPFPVPYILAFFMLKKLLHRLRNQTRYSKINGKEMRKLSEEEEDEFLEQGHIEEEAVGSVDYDVWVTEDYDEVLILKYAKRFSKYASCPKCSFKTYFLSHTETLVYATYSNSGLKEVIHECNNCNYRKVEEHVIPQKVRSSSGGGSGFGGGGGGSSFGGGSSGGGGAGVSW